MHNHFDWILADEWTARDPMGKIKPADAVDGSEPRAVAPRAPRGGYASFRIVVRGEGRFRLDVAFEGGLSADLYRAWYHPLAAVKGRPACAYPDALVPAARGDVFAIPDPDNRIAGQRVQEFWVDVYAPPDAAPGPVAGRVRLTAGHEVNERAVTVEVLKARLPDEPCMVVDNNSYGARWLPGYYPRTLCADPATPRDWRAVTRILQHYYRIAHEHRACFHNLGYGHSGQFDPIYGPRAVGRGRDRRLTDWALFDNHYGPLLDGSAFATAAPGLPPPRRAATPVWGVYTPINPDWPADYLWWGEPGYETEFTRGVRQFDAHFRERGWTRSRVEFFFNHKKRYRWFEWDGDEVKHTKDDPYHLEMIRLWKDAIGRTPVPWVYRVDASWRMKQQFDVLAGARNFWVCGGFCAWYPREIQRVRERGEIIINYCGYPVIAASSGAVLQDLYRNWARGLHGFTEWLTTNPGRDPWFACDGVPHAAFYPGERFGIDGPIPSIRLKVLRNGIQDIDLLHQAAMRGGGEKGLAAARANLVRAIGVPVWQQPPRVARERPAEEWDSVNLAAEHEPIAAPDERLGPGWWSIVRERAAAAAQGKGRA